jgi:hypothetical protein
MTREEAITVLKAFMENPLFSDVHKAAFNIAIHDIKQRHDWDINNLILNVSIKLLTLNFLTISYPKTNYLFLIIICGNDYYLFNKIVNQLYIIIITKFHDL